LSVARDPVVNVERGLVVDVVEDMAIEEAAAELTSIPSYELWLLKSVRGTKRGDFASNFTRRDTVSS
jgi:hypothetical protein